MGILLDRRGRDECKAQLFGPDGEVSEGPLFLGLLKGRLPRIHVGLPLGQESVDDPGQLVGRGHDPALFSQPGTHSSIIGPQSRVAVFERARCQAKSLAHPVVALRHFPRDHLPPTRDPRSRRHAGPGGEVLSARKRRQVASHFGGNDQRGGDPNAVDGRQVHSQHLVKRDLDVEFGASSTESVGRNRSIEFS